MKVKKKDNIRYRFTGYVLAALKRAKRDYICREIKISNHESPLEKMLPEPLCDMESQIGESGETALDALTDMEILVVFMKVFRQLTYQEIGRHLGMDYKKAGSVFNYAKKKMRKGWKIRNEF